MFPESCNLAKSLNWLRELIWLRHRKHPYCFQLNFKQQNIYHEKDCSKTVRQIWKWPLIWKSSENNKLKIIQKPGFLLISVKYSKKTGFFDWLKLFFEIVTFFFVGRKKKWQNWNCHIFFRRTKKKVTKSHVTQMSHLLCPNSAVI